MGTSFQRKIVSKTLKSLKYILINLKTANSIPEQKCQERVKFLGKVFLNLRTEKKKMAVLKRSLVLLYSLKQSHSVIRAHFLILKCFFFLFCVAELIRDG